LFHPYFHCGIFLNHVLLQTYGVLMAERKLTKYWLTVTCLVLYQVFSVLHNGLNDATVEAASARHTITITHPEESHVAAQEYLLLLASD
jgi:hypothetical protein